MSDVGSPGPITGTIGGAGGASPNPEAMIASSSSVKSKFFFNEFFFQFEKVIQRIVFI